MQSHDIVRASKSSIIHSLIVVAKLLLLLLIVVIAAIITNGSLIVVQYGKARFLPLAISVDKHDHQELIVTGPMMISGVIKV